MIVYAASRKDGGKTYVGQTCRPLPIRIKEHRRHSLQSDRHHGAFHKALRSLGIEAFDWTVLEECTTAESLDEAERRWIERLNCTVPNGYNLDGGGNQNKERSAETRARLSAALTGHSVSDATRWKISNSKRGMTYRERTEAHKEKLSAVKVGEKNPRSKLTWEKVREIRNLSRGGISQSKIAARYDISQSCVSKIVRNESWI